MAPIADAVSAGKIQRQEAHTADGRAGVVEKDSIAGVVGKRPMGVTEVTMVDFLAPCGQNVVEMLRHAGDRGILGEMPLMEAQRNTR